MACDVCRALRLWERERERERERKEPQESEYPLRSFVFVILCRNCRWTVTSTCTRVLKRYQFSYQRSKTPRGYKGYVRWGRVRFSLARLFHSFSFFFFSSFRDDKLWHLRAEEKFLNLVLVIPCLFRCLSPDRVSMSVVQSPEKALVIFFLAWVSHFTSLYPRGFLKKVVETAGNCQREAKIEDGR